MTPSVPIDIIRTRGNDGLPAWRDQAGGGAMSFTPRPPFQSVYW